MDPKGRRWHQNWGQGERILVHLYFIIILYLLLQRMPPKQELDLVDICQHVFVQHGNTPYIWKSQGGGLGTSEGRGGKPWVLPPLLPLPTVYCNPVEVNHIFLNLERMGHGLRDRQKLVTVRVKSATRQQVSRWTASNMPPMTMRVCPRCLSCVAVPVRQLGLATATFVSSTCFLYLDHSAELPEILLTKISKVLLLAAKFLFYKENKIQFLKVQFSGKRGSFEYKD